MQISIRKKKIYSKKRGRKILRYLKFRKECDEMKKIIKYILTFCGLLLIFNVLLFTSSLFPSRLIEKNVRESSKILTKEDNIYKFFDWCDVVNNNYTDVLMINEAYSIDNTNPVYSYMAVRKNYEKGLTENSLPDTNGESISINSPYYYDPVGELEDFLDGNIVTSVNYARYWHGYLPILRPLLIFFNKRYIHVHNFIYGMFNFHSKERAQLLHMPYLVIYLNIHLYIRLYLILQALYILCLFE